MTETWKSLAIDGNFTFCSVTHHNRPALKIIIYAGEVCYQPNGVMVSFWFELYWYGLHIKANGINRVTLTLKTLNKKGESSSANKCTG